MANILAEGFEMLLSVHGSDWVYEGTSFRAIAQSGAYAAYNFVDGNTAIKILRYRSADLPKCPKAGEYIKSYSGKSALIRNSKAVDEIFSELEIDEI